jgi:group I intron endonuclease
MIIYKTTNLINGKIYIGQDSKNNPKYLGSGKIIKLAIKKYGKENFKKEILEYCDTFAELNDREIFWIFNLDSQNKKIGYNILSGQSPTEIILKLWADPNSYLNSPEYRKKLSDKMKLLWLDSSSIFNSDNFSKNISYTVKNLWNDSESTYNSSEYRKKLSDSQKNRIFSEFDIEQMRINIKKYINGENGYWYKYRPYQALEQLNEVTQLVRKELEEGIVLPNNIQLVVYKSLKDGTADPVSVALLKRGIHTIDGGNIDVVMVNSQLHVFTRLRGRNEFSKYWRTIF